MVSEVQVLYVTLSGLHDSSYACRTTENFSSEEGKVHVVEKLYNIIVNSCNINMSPFLLSLETITTLTI